jgi:hypothetical protein
MTNEEIYELAEEHGDWDDFGRWTFRDNDRLLAFVLAVQGTKQEPVAWREVAGKTTHYYDYNENGRGEPLYPAPVHAIDMSQERVDETAKCGHEPVAQCTYPKCQATNGCVGACSKTAPVHAIHTSEKHVHESDKDRHEWVEPSEFNEDYMPWKFKPPPKREWVGLTDEDIDLYAFDEGVTDNKAPAWLVTYARGIEAKLKEKNHG